MSVINKRQQARNERALQDLIKSVPGNDKCADCGARNPGWASWNLGIFLCVRCASLHRKLGTHVSKIKSLSMDTWTSDQVDNMKKIGNNASNKIFNPRGSKPAMPIDIDEVDGVMERYIRQKYDSKMLSSSQPGSTQHTGSSSADDRTAELPPKPSKRFTFALRSTASSLPFRSAEKSPPVSPAIDSFTYSRRSPQRKTKPSKIFGTDIGGSRQDNYELKLVALREMGFPDDKRNLTILKGENGNVDRAVATLIRLGEGAKMSSGESSPMFPPETPPKDEPSGVAKPNPFDRMDLNEKALPPPPPVEELSPQPVTAMINSNVYNPFLQPSQPAQSLEQSFQGLQVSQPSQLFPNTTGGYITPHQTPNTNPFLQTYTPPPAPLATGGFAYGHYGHQTMQPLQPVLTGSNPFLSQIQQQPQQQQGFASANPFGVPQQNGLMIQQQLMPQATGNPFQQMQQQQQQMQSHQPSVANPFPTQSPAGQLSNPFNTLYQQQQQQPQMAPQIQSQNPFLGSIHPAFANPNPVTGLSQFTQTPTQSPIQQLSTGTNPFHAPFQSHSQSHPIPSVNRVDKASILALYATPQQIQQPIHTGLPTPSDDFATQSLQQQQQQQQQHQQPFQLGHQAKRSATMPLPTIPSGQVAPNPFAPQVATPGQQRTAMASVIPSQVTSRPNHESIDFMASGLLNGRHSPDIFSGLSARIGR